jgi:hypothetical protein
LTAIPGAFRLRACMGVKRVAHPAQGLSCKERTLLQLLPLLSRVHSSVAAVALRRAAAQAYARDGGWDDWGTNRLWPPHSGAHQWSSGTCVLRAGFQPCLPPRCLCGCCLGWGYPGLTALPAALEGAAGCKRFLEAARW